MKKKIFSLMLIFIILAFSMNVYADNAEEAKVTQGKISLNSAEVSICGFNIKNNNYFKLRELASIFENTSSRFNVIWNENDNVIEIRTGEKYKFNENSWEYFHEDKLYKATPCTSKIMVDGEYKEIKAYTINGSNYFKLRDLGELIPFEVDWNEEKKEISLFSHISSNSHRINVGIDISDNSLYPYFSRWSGNIKQYLLDNEDETFSIFEALYKEIIVSTYDDSYNLLYKKTIPLELPIFGAFYSGEIYNYIAFGDYNREEDDEKEVIRVVKYDKEFNKIGSVSVYGKDCFTTVPFNASCSRMAENNDILVFHTSRERYKTEDGLNHQSQLTIIIDTENMKVTNDLGLFQSNHVSHSFDQYVQFDGDKHFLVDHGDAYPRSIYLSKQSGEFYEGISLFDIPGDIGANCTGVSIGGFEISDSDFIVAINTIDHSKVKKYTNFSMEGIDVEQRDIVICTVPKNSTSVKQTTLAKYVDTDKVGTVPKLVKISEERFAVLWQEYDIVENNGKERANLKYVFIDGEGNLLSDVIEIKGYILSNCQPIVFNNNIMWMTNLGRLQIIYNINL